MTTPSLIDAHAALHAWFEDTLYVVIEALVQIDVYRALQRLNALEGVLDEHMAYEDERVLPIYKTLAPADGPGRADHIVGDHVVIKRNLGLLREQIEALDEHSKLREVLTKLPFAYRVISTLEHHTLREQNNMYPAFMDVAGKAAVDDVIGVLTDLVRRASTL